MMRPLEAVACLIFDLQVIIDPMQPQVKTGDIVQLRKKHPCGSDRWEVVRVGVDIGLVCRACGRRIMLPRSKFNRRCKAIVSSSASE